MKRMKKMENKIKDKVPPPAPVKRFTSTCLLLKCFIIYFYYTFIILLLYFYYDKYK